MIDFIFLMHDDAPGPVGDWGPYLAKLRATGRFEGGSVIGDGGCFRKTGPAGALSRQIGGYLKLEARDLADARSLLDGNPVYEAGGTVEIRELPRS